MSSTLYAPGWVLNTVCSSIALRYVEGNLPIEAFANRMSKTLIKSYRDCEPEKLYTTAEAMLFFLAEIEDENAITYCNAFIQNSVMFESSGRPRKLKGLFYNPLAPAKENTTGKKVLLSFKAFVFKLRNGHGIALPENWHLSSIAELKPLYDALNVEVSFSDAI